jgi:hypothetical protein
MPELCAAKAVTASWILASSFGRLRMCLTICSASFSVKGHKNPCLKALAARGLTPMWELQSPEWISFSNSLLCAIGIHFNHGVVTPDL